MYNLSRNKIAEITRCQTNVLNCLADKRDGKLSIRVPKWMENQIKESGKSEADFIIAKLAETMFKGIEIDEEAWAEEIKDL